MNGSIDSIRNLDHDLDMRTDICTVVSLATVENNLTTT